MSEKKHLVALYAFSYFGPVRTKLLIKYFKTAGKVWVASKKDLLEVGLKEKVVENFIGFRKRFEMELYFKKLEDKKIDVTTIDEKKYPSFLKGIPDAPLVLYYKGDITKVGKYKVGVVGTRKMTVYGRAVTQKITSELAGYQITIVSGLARGVDATAHRAALEAGTKTIAVLPCGLDMVYPPENRSLLDAITKNGAVVSEYPLGHPPVPVNFASRNRIISGISNLLVVVEGARRSGTLLTASKAADQGRTVFAVPGEITSPMSQAPHFLIQNGATALFETSQILDELDFDERINSGPLLEAKPGDEMEEKILDVLECENIHLDEIVRITELTIGEVSSKLTVMEIKGMVKNLGSGSYKKI